MVLARKSRNQNIEPATCDRRQRERARARMASAAPLPADPKLLAAGAQMLAAMQAKQAKAKAPVMSPNSANAVATLEEEDFQCVTERLGQLLYAFGDADVPAPANVSLALGLLLNMQYTAVSAALRAAEQCRSVFNRESQTRKTDRRFLKALRRFYRDEWESYLGSQEAEEAEAMEEEGEHYQPNEHDRKAQQLEDDDDDDDDKDETVATAQSTAAADGGSSSTDAAAAAGGDGGDGGGVANAAARAARMRFLDDRTADMSSEEYDAFAALRSVRGQTRYLAAFSRLCALNLRGVFSIKAASANLAVTTSVRFLAKLWADRVADIIENANRRCHGGELRVPTAPIAEAHYKAACAELLDADAQAERRRRERAAPVAAPVAAAAAGKKPMDAGERGPETKRPFPERQEPSSILGGAGPWMAAAAAAKRQKEA